MSEIKVFHDDNSDIVLQHSKQHDEIAAILREQSVRFERWQTAAAIEPGDSQDQVMAAYRKDINRLMQTEGYQTVDVVSLQPNHPDKNALREKFLHEHRHAEDEVRFFVAGQGLFSLHIADKVYEVLCCQGDLISVPANTAHWFDMGPNPSFVAIRLFNNPEGWIAHYTGADIAARFSRLQN